MRYVRASTGTRGRSSAGRLRPVLPPPSAATRPPHGAIVMPGSTGHACRCYCAPDELGESEHKGQRKPPVAHRKYDRTCRNLGSDEIAQLEAAGAPRAVRFLVPEEGTAFDDLVHGPIRFDNANVEDFVVLRSDRQPTYHLSVVADDIDMGISHVIRGDDHISNTPKQVLLYQAFGQSVPAFAHVPLILGTDKEATEQAARRHVGDRVSEDGLPAAGDGQLPGPARMVARQRPRAVAARRTDCPPSRSRTSAAATRCSIRKSSTG